MATQRVNQLVHLAEYELSNGNDGAVGVHTHKQHAAALVSSFRDIANLLRLTSKLHPGEYLIYTPENSSQGVAIKKEDVSRYISAYATILEGEEMYLKAATISWSRFKGVPGRRNQKVRDGVITLEPAKDREVTYNLVYGPLLSFYREIDTLIQAATGKSLEFLKTTYSLDDLRTAVRARMNFSSSNAKEVNEVRRGCAAAMQGLDDMVQKGLINDSTQFVLVSSRVHQMIVSWYNAKLSGVVLRPDFKPISRKSFEGGRSPYHIQLKVNRVIDLTQLINGQANLISKYFQKEINEMITTHSSGLDKKPVSSYMTLPKNAPKPPKAKLRFDPARAQHTDTISIVSLSKNNLSAAGPGLLKAFLNFNTTSGLVKDIANSKLDADVKLLISQRPNVDKSKKVFDMIGSGKDGYYGTLNSHIGEFQLYVTENHPGKEGEFVAAASDKLTEFFRENLGYNGDNNFGSGFFLARLILELRNDGNMQLGRQARVERERQAQMRQARS